MRDGGAGGALAALKKVRVDIADPDAVAFALREARPARATPARRSTPPATR